MFLKCIANHTGIKEYVLPQENLSLGCSNRSCSNQPAQLQRQVKIFYELTSTWFRSHSLQEVNNRGTDQTAWKCRLVLQLCYWHTTKSGFLTWQLKATICKKKELSYVFTINMFRTAENRMEK